LKCDLKTLLKLLRDSKADKWIAKEYCEALEKELRERLRKNEEIGWKSEWINIKEILGK